MVAAAARRLGAEMTMLAEGHDFRLPAPVDAVFSNAALHWMPRPGEVVGRVRAALLPQVQARVNELAAPRLRRGGEWFADDWRPRILAIADPPATRPRRVPAGSSSRLE